MDAQNAAESDQTKSPAGASPQQQSLDAKSPRDGPTLKAESPPKETKPRRDSGDLPADRDSDAETVVLPGKDGYSPSKARKVRQEDKSDVDGDTSKAHNATDSATANRRGASGSDRDDQTGRSADEQVIKKRRRLSAYEKEKQSRNKDGSSGLSSAPTSPPQRHRQVSRRRSVNSRSSLSDYEHPHDSNNISSSSKTSLRDKLKSGERLLPHKRKAIRADSDDEDDTRKARRQRTTSAGFEGARLSKESKSANSKANHDSRTRSPSPPARLHRRSVSSQLPSQSSNGGVVKKKRLPPPLQPTDYNSDESSASNSPHPRNAKLRSLATPAHAESTTSPLKMPSHKKHLDAHGQTLLARACARGEYEAAKHRLGDRPEDLNVADYAGNTPLQIAAINGCEDIVKLLIDAGCNLDCVNYDKDTPLLDAVDNGHLAVVKQLLDAGVNPRKANVNGEEPLDRVNEETENAEEIRQALLDARKRAGMRAKTSEDRHSHPDTHDTRGSAAPESPRRSPAIATSAQSLGRRAGTVRATKTRNDLLYMALDEKTLRQAAGRGDTETVARVLQVKEGCDDAESMVAAARGGHNLVIELLLSLGGASPDPKPLSSQPDEFSTPMLAAIGQENFKVVDLLLKQPGFDPTRRFKGETYYEVAKRRQGTNWKEEEQILKKAYDAFKNSKGKTKSPGRREEKRVRREDKDETKMGKRTPLSPSHDADRKKAASSSSRVSSPKEKKKKRSDTLDTQPDENVPKRTVSKQRKDDRSSTNLSDRENSPQISSKQPKAARAESDFAVGSSEGESAKPRRKKLVSKGELRGERDRHRRPSMASNPSRPASPHDSKHDEPGEKAKLSEKYHNRAKALKRDESKDGLSASGDATSKRHRSSLTPDRPGNGTKDDGDAPVKRRRLEGETAERRHKHPSSTESHLKSAKSAVKNHGEDSKETSRKDSARASGSESSVPIKSEEVDVEMPDVQPSKDAQTSDDATSERKAQLAQEEAKREEIRKKKKQQQEEAEAAKKREEEEESRRKKEEAEKEARKKKEEEEAAEKRRREEEEQEKKRLAEEAARREAEEKARREVAEKARVEEEKKRKEEEEERLRKEREAAEEARRKREEEERKERERRERAHREELERKRAAREAEQKRIREEQERARVEQLPPLLRWLALCPNPKLPAYAEKFKHIQGVRYDTIQPDANNSARGREQWVLNTHAALLLGEKDMDLSRC